MFEFERFAKGTFGVAHALAEVTASGGVTSIHLLTFRRMEAMTTTGVGGTEK